MQYGDLSYVSKIAYDLFTFWSLWADALNMLTVKMQETDLHKNSLAFLKSKLVCGYLEDATDWAVTALVYSYRRCFIKDRYLLGFPKQECHIYLWFYTSLVYHPQLEFYYFLHCDYGFARVYMFNFK